MPPMEGRQFGRYEIRSLLGKGGMGEVYLAHDTQLPRLVALKLLPEEYAKESDRLRRFKREAHTASALNHPNLVTVYEVGQVDATPYIVMEYVEGITLRRRLKEKRLSVAEAVEVAAQVGEALAAAHRAGIIHRDIKLENIMLRGDGYVKVLDFGLAKLAGTHTQAAATPEAPTITNQDTGPGNIVGTAAYMSPEQLRGSEVDERSDLWSLGVMLYEMLTVTVPFKGHSTGQVIVSILEREPEPLAPKLPQAPVELQQIVTKALQKDRGARYQTAAEMVADLRRLARRLETSEGVWPAHAADEAQPAPPGARVTASQDAPATAEQPTTTAALAAAGAGAAAGSGSFGWRAPRLSDKRIWAAALLLGVGLLGLLTGRFYVTSRKPADPTQSIRFQRLALPSTTRDAVISPDGQYVAGIVEQGGKDELLILERSTLSALQIAGPSASGYDGLSFSPDGDYIYYLENEAETGTLFRVSKLGGLKRKLLENVNTPVTFSPDGSRFTFVRYDMKEQATVLVTAGVEGTNETGVAARKGRGLFLIDMEGPGPAWAPRDDVVACLSYRSEGGKVQIGVEVVSLADGSSKDLTPQNWSRVSSLSWLSDGSGLILTGSVESADPQQLWLLSYPGGEVRRITNDASYYRRASLTGDARTLLALTLEKRSSLWLVEPGRDGQQTLLSDNVPSSNDDIPVYPATEVSWTPDGKIVYSARTPESQNIWIRESGGGVAKQLTFEKNQNHRPAVTPDGRYIVFVSSRAGGSTIWRMDIDGSHPTQLTSGQQDDMPQVTPDSGWVVYRTVEGIWKVPVAGGESVPLMKKNAIYPVVSPDGLLLACLTSASPGGSVWSVEVFRLADMSLVKRFFPPQPFAPFAGLRWTHDGNALAYVGSADGASNIWLQPLTRETPRKITDFKDSNILSFGWAPGRNQAACVRVTESVRALLITGFRDG
jgi:Tol biopolymer transport system component